MTVEELLGELGADEIAQRVRAIAWAVGQGAAGAQRLAEVLRRPDASPRAQAWAMIGLAQMGPAVADVARDAVVEKLSDPSPMTRRGAIGTLERLHDVASRDAIAALVTDDTVDPGAWFDDDCTVAHAARAALATLDEVKTTG